MRRIPWMLAGLFLLGGCDTSHSAAMQKTAEGLQHVNRDDYQRAVRCFEQAIAANAGIAEPHYYIGLIRLQHYHDPAGAVNDLETAVGLEVDDPSLRPEMLYQYGVALEQIERDEQARAQYEAVIAIEATHARALYRLGVMIEEAGEIREAIDYYHRSIYADPRFPFAYNALGNIYLRYGRPQEAIQVFENAIQNCPEDTQNLADIARVYMAIEEYDAAITYLRRAVDMQDEAVAVHYNLGVAYRERYIRAHNPADRDEATLFLDRARQRCNPSEEQARCDSIEAALRDLRTEGSGEGP